jgi:hypothetical protein
VPHSCLLMLKLGEVNALNDSVGCHVEYPELRSAPGSAPGNAPNSVPGDSPWGAPGQLGSRYLLTNTEARAPQSYALACLNRLE